MEDSAQLFPYDPSGQSIIFPPTSTCLPPCSLALTMHYSFDFAQHVI